MEPWRTLITAIVDKVCAHESIDPIQSKVELRFLVKNEVRCALEIAVRGPRRMRPTALWSWGDTKVLYYDSAGKRWAEDLLEGIVVPPQELLELWGKL
jgi:hypothetical protein